MDTGISGTQAQRRTRGGWRRSPVKVGAALVVIIMAALLAAGCGGSATATTAPATAGGPTTSSAVGAQVVMKNIAFDSTRLTIKVGQTVTWVNQDSAQHDVVANNGEFKSSLFGAGGTFSFTFTKAGTYPYNCSIHPHMTGTIIVL